MQGLFSAVWGGTAIIGPAVGGIITTTVGWPWVFWINLPIGVFATILFVRVFNERFDRVPHRIDWWGAILLTGGVDAAPVHPLGRAAASSAMPRRPSSGS